jgi:signal peptidase I
MLGDNRDNSTDSRVLSQVGYIPLDHIVGRVQMIFLSIDRERTPAVVRTDRLGMIVR